MFARIAHLTLLATSLLGPCILSATFSATVLAQDASTPAAQAAAPMPPSSGDAPPAPPSQDAVQAAQAQPAPPPAPTPAASLPTSTPAEASMPAPGTTSALPTAPPPVVTGSPALEQAVSKADATSVQPPASQGNPQAVGTSDVPNTPQPGTAPNQPPANDGGAAASNTPEPAAAASTGPANAPASQTPGMTPPSSAAADSAPTAPNPSSPTPPATTVEPAAAPGGKSPTPTENSAKAPSPAASDKAPNAASDKATEPVAASAPEVKDQAPASNAAAATTPAPAADPDAPPSLSEARKRELCKLYEGGFITYYGSVYKVHQCKRYELTTDEIYDHTKRSGKLREVDNDTIRALAFAGTYHDDYLATDKVSPCKKYNRQYITYAVDVYWVERCIKRVFPDWASYESHRGKLGTGNSQLHFVSWQEFASFKEGRSMPSVIDEEFRELSDTVDIIPIDEACRGVVGQYVTYFDHIYFVESAQRSGAKKGAKSGPLACRKRMVDGEDYTRRHGHRRFHLKELSSSQAVSIPDGAPVKPKDDKNKPQDNAKKKARS